MIRNEHEIMASELMSDGTEGAQRRGYQIRKSDPLHEQLQQVLPSERCFFLCDLLVRACMNATLQIPINYHQA